ncbi:7643_t:CDS:2, partial [Dentiscutata erythropus]
MEHTDASSTINENNSLMASETDSVVTTQSSYNTRGRAHDMETHLAMKCKGKVPKEIRTKVLRDLQS